MTGLGHQARLTWSISHVPWGGYEVTPWLLICVLSFLTSFVLLKLLCSIRPSPGGLGDRLSTRAENSSGN